MTGQVEITKNRIKGQPSALKFSLCVGSRKESD